jgi:voltage-gated potassium channel
MEHKSYPYLIFMLFLSILAVAVLAADAIISFDPGTHSVLHYADLIVCCFFCVDFLYMFIHAENKWKYMATWGWLDLISSIPMLDMLRWGRTARIVRIVRILRGIRSARILVRFIMECRAQSAFLAVVLFSILLVTISSLCILHCEADANSNIQTPEDAVWWAITTISTVGYGDKYPVTSGGRVIAGVLMVAGVGLFGTFSGFVAAWFLEPTELKQENDFAAIQKEIAELKQLILESRKRDAS